MTGRRVAERLRDLVERMLDGREDLVAGCRELARLRNRGCDFIPEIFVGFDSELDEVPMPEVRPKWDPDALRDAMRRVDPYREDILEACANLFVRLNSPTDTVLLWRPVGQVELDLIAKAGYRRFPPRLPQQPIFYPVCNEQYAIEIAVRWNLRDEGAGFVTRFRVLTVFLLDYEPQVVGARHHQEYWIPAEDLAHFNDAIVGSIEIVNEYRRAEDKD